MIDADNASSQRPQLHSWREARYVAPPVESKCIFRKPDLRYVDGSGKVIVDQHLAPDQKSITSRGSPLAPAYHVWSTSANTAILRDQELSCSSCSQAT